MKREYVFLTLGVVVASLASQVNAKPRVDHRCPIALTTIAPKLDVTVERDTKTGLFNYRYKLQNGADSKLAIDEFGLNLGKAPAGYVDVPHWNHDGGVGFSDLEGQTGFLWRTSEMGKKNANRPFAGGPKPPALYAVKPGKFLDGVGMLSKRPPGIVEYFAKGDGWDILPGEDGEPLTCPGWNPSERNLVRGMTVGPADPDLVSVKIRLRDRSGIRPSSPIDPKNPAGQIGVLLFSAQNFDATQVDSSKLTFGPAKVGPMSSRFVSSGLGEKLEGDVVSDWERITEKFQSNDAASRKNPFQNLLLVFDVSKLDVQCGIDQALFLRGVTKSGLKFVGAAPARLVGCKVGEPGVHKARDMQAR